MARVTPPSLRDEIDRIAAAVGTSVVHQDPAAPADTRIWAAAGAVVVDSAAALHLARSAPPRRSGVFVVTEGALGADLPDNVVLSAALALGAEAVLALPGQSDELVRVLSLPAGGAPVTGAGGRLVAVAGGRGGAGSSVFASALALSCAESLLIDLDPGGGGIDLVVGAEATAGLRWPEIHVLDGRLSWAAVREALPRHRGVSVLSGSRRAHDVPSAAVESFIEAGRRGGVTVVCDLSRAHTDAARIALCAADLVVVVATCDGVECHRTQHRTGRAWSGAGGAEVGGVRHRGRAAVVDDNAARTDAGRAAGTRRAGTSPSFGTGARRSAGAGRAQPWTAGDDRPCRVNAPLIDRVRERLASEAGPLRATMVARAIRAESGGVVGDTEVLASLRVLQTELTGAGILEPLLAGPATTDVLVTPPGQVWVDDGNRLRDSGIRFPDEAAVRRLAQRLALAAGRRLDDAAPWVDGLLTDVGQHRSTVRLHAVLPPISVGGTSISLRVLRPASQDLDSLCATGAIPPGAVAADERIVCVEDAAELAPRHPHVVNLVARGPNVEGAGEVTVRQLVRQALRMRPDRIVVGEVRGAEVVDLLAALNTGHDGGAGTVHANSAAEIPARLEALAAVGGLDRVSLHAQLWAAVRVLLHVARDGAGRRRLAEIAVLRSEGSEGCRAVAAWRAGDGLQDGAAQLRRMLAGASP